MGEAETQRSRKDREGQGMFLQSESEGGKNTAPSRLVYELARETLFTEDLRMKLLLPATKPYMELLHRSKLKKREIDFDFYAMGAMLERNWMKANQDLGHVVTRYAVHGFHDKVCENKEVSRPK